MKNKALIITVAVVCAALIIAGFFFFRSRSGSTDADGGSDTTDAVTTVPEDGVHYIYHEGINKKRIESSVTYENGAEISRNEYEYWEDGKLKTITTKVDGKVTDTWNYLYGQNGLLVEMVRTYTSEGSQCRDDYKYTEKGELSEISWYTDNTSEGGLRYSYTEKGELSLEEQLDPNGDVVTYTEYKFDEAGKTTSAHTFMYGSETGYSIYEYTEKGLLDTVKYYKKSGELTNELRYEYNSDSKQTKVLTCDSEGVVISHVESLYNENGFNYRDVFYEDGKPVYCYDYTEDGARVYSAYN